MKIQCSCGAKYALDITPGMPPVTFVCPACGQDYSAFINDAIRQQYGEQAASPPEQPPQAAAPLPPAAPEATRLRISRPQHTAPPAEQAPTSKYCSKHRTELATGQCQVCHQPICPKCIETFGIYCSAFCKAKVEGALSKPAITGQRFLSQREFWRKTGLIIKVTGVLLVAGLAFWIWYAWIASVPKPSFSVRWDDISHSGTSRIVDGNQLLFLHGGTLARYNLETKQKVWSLDLVSSQQVAAVLAQQDAEASEEIRKYGSATGPTLLPANLRQKNARISQEMALSLYGTRKNVWVAENNVLTHYDWDSGNVLQQITVTNSFGELIEHNDELLAVGPAGDGANAITHINMDDGEQRTEEAPGPGSTVVTLNAPSANSGGGLPLSANGQNGQLNPQRVAQDAQNLSLPARLALPALLGNSEHQRQINQELNDEDGRPRNSQSTQAGQGQRTIKLGAFSLVPDGDSYIAFSSQLMHENIVQHEAMKAPSQNSAINGNLSTANETAAVNEQLNEIQRNNGGDTVSEDESTYQVALRRPGSTGVDWVGDVTGPPQFFPLDTVNVLAAGKSITVFDKSDKQLWQANLTYDVTGGDGQLYQSTFGAGPCVEHNGTLYVFDQAVLTAYDPNSGNVRWRIPSVGVVGLFFDDQGMLYVNTTTGNPDDIKYSRQIDVTKQTEAIVMKVNPATGATLWTSNPGGYISYLSGKFIYADQYFDPGDQEDQTSDALTDLEKPPYFRIMRINPGNGHTMWFYNEGRAPVDIQFDRNQISIVLKKEVEVLKFFTF